MEPFAPMTRATGAGRSTRRMRAAAITRGDTRPTSASLAASYVATVS